MQEQQHGEDDGFQGSGFQAAQSYGLGKLLGVKKKFESWKCRREANLMAQVWTPLMERTDGKRSKRLL